MNANLTSEKEQDLFYTCQFHTGTVNSLQLLRETMYRVL